MSKAATISPISSVAYLFKVFLWLPLVIIFFSMQSCKAKKDTGDFPRKYADQKFVIDQLSENQANFEWMSARLKISYDDGNQDLTSPGHLRMRKDSIIWISVAPVLGIEALRILITTDSVHVLNRLDKTYSIYPISIVKKYTGTDEVNFQTLQDVLVGNSMLPLSTDFTASIEEQLILLEKIGQFNKESLHISPDIFRILSTQIIRSQSNQQATVAYTNHHEVNNQIIPRKIAINVANPIQVKMAIEYGKITLNKPEAMNFQVPTHYERN